MKTRSFFKKISIVLIILLPLFFIAEKGYSSNLSDENTIIISDTGGEQMLILDLTDCTSCGDCLDLYPNILIWYNGKPKLKDGIYITLQQAQDLVDICPAGCFSII